MDSGLFVILVGAVGTFITAYSAKWGIDGRLGAALFAIAAGAFYSAFNLFLPEGVKEYIIVFVIATWGSAVIIYDYLIKERS